MLQGVIRPFTKLTQTFHKSYTFFFSKEINDSLTHYQTTNFRLFQTERVCRQQFQIRRKWKKVIQIGRKHCGKRRNCSFLLETSNFSFSHSVCKRFVSQGSQKVSLCGNGLTHYQMTNFRLFQTERVCRRQFQIGQKWQQVIQTGRKHCGKRRNCSL